MATELLNSDYNVKQIYGTGNWLRQNSNLAVPCKEITETELHRISGLISPHEVILIAEQKTPGNEPVTAGKITLVLDGIRDPGNLGTIIRIADWFGIDQIVCSHDCVELYNPKTVQATMGSIARITCWYKDVEDWTKEVKLPVLGAVLNGENIYTFPSMPECLLVIGNESHGIREPLLARITTPITIPKVGGAEFLNAAVAAESLLGNW